MKRLTALLALLSLFSFSGFGQNPGSDVPRLAVERHKLGNGLEILLVEDHRLPRVAVNLWYHVGPVNEEPGRTGFAHLFEHMMFQQSKHIPEDQHFKYLEAAGATDINGTTDFDRTNYFETLPSSELELGLWLESDRMGYLLDKIDAKALANQQDVVRNERRQSVENNPFGIVEEAMFHKLFPPTHPYYASVIGSHKDIQAARIADVQRFFKQYYTPNNASLAIVGDIDKVRTMQLVEKYFGTLKKGPDVPAIRATTPAITAERRVTVQDRVELPRLYMAWLTPSIFKTGDAEASLAAGILGGGKSSRLYKSLVYEKQIAQDVTAEQWSYTLGSLFVLKATARKGHTLEELEKEIQAQLDAIRKSPADRAELDRAKANIETQAFFSLERLGGFSGIADRINMYNHHLKNPDYFAEDIARFRRVTPEQVQQFAQKYLSNSARVVVRGVPGTPDYGTPVPTPDKAADVSGPAQSVNVDEPWRNQHPASGNATALKVPSPEQFKLANGLTVVVDQRKAVPVVTANLVFRSGTGANPIDKPGLASITVDMLDEGTASRSAAQFADQLAQIGATLTTSALLDSASMKLGVTKSRFQPGLDLLADAILNPAFAEAELERQRQSRLGSLTQEKEDPSAVADRVLSLAMNGTRSSYGYTELGTEESLQAIKRDDLRSFWAQHLVPNNAALVVSGDISAIELRPMLEKAFANWKPGSALTVAQHTAEPTDAKLWIVDKPGAPQTQLRIAMPGPSRSTEDYEQIQVMNGILGGGFSGRINMNLREEHGYTYGANSRFTYLKDGGWFTVSSGVRTDVTVPAVREVIREIGRITETTVTKDELGLVKERLVGSLPSRFETSDQSVGMFSDIYVYDLGADYYTKYARKVGAVTDQVVQDIAKKYLAGDQLKFILVGDRSKIEEDLKKLGLGKLELRDATGKRLP